MSSENGPDRAKIEARLRALRQDNYRRARWQAIDAARSLDPKMKWDEIGAALGVMPHAASRFYTQDRPVENA